MRRITKIICVCKQHVYRNVINLVYLSVQRALCVYIILRYETNHENHMCLQTTCTSKCYQSCLFVCTTSILCLYNTSLWDESWKSYVFANNMYIEMLSILFIPKCYQSCLFVCTTSIVCLYNTSLWDELWKSYVFANNMYIEMLSILFIYLYNVQCVFV